MRREGTTTITDWKEKSGFLRDWYATGDRQKLGDAASTIRMSKNAGVSILLLDPGLLVWMSNAAVIGSLQVSLFVYATSVLGNELVV